VESFFPVVLIVGVLTVASLFFGKAVRKIKLPAIVGYMFLGVLAGPSCFHIFNGQINEQLSFLTALALGFVALSIGLELRMSWLKKQGWGIIITILGQCFGAFIVVTLAVYGIAALIGTPSDLGTSRQLWSMALLFGALATATAPAGTMAVIKEYRARGSLTQTLYVVVGYDDALSVIIYGFCIAIARTMLSAETGGEVPSFLLSMVEPCREVLLSILVGVLTGGLFCVLSRRILRSANMLALLVGMVLIVNGLSSMLHLSFILTNMVLGLMVVNTQPHDVLGRIREGIENIIPLLFVFLFSLAGANLELGALTELGMLGGVYIVARSIGKVAGAGISARAGKLEEKIIKYLGIGLLSQAGVAIGLALLARHELKGVGVDVGDVGTSGDLIGSVLLMTITASCVFFEVIGPILAKVSLEKAGEIPKDRRVQG
jgi:Kef-type K+ transport system membrane component KefB